MSIRVTIQRISQQWKMGRYHCFLILATQTAFLDARPVSSKAVDKPICKYNLDVTGLQPFKLLNIRNQPVKPHHIKITSPFYPGISYSIQYPHISPYLVASCWPCFTPTIGKSPSFPIIWLIIYIYIYVCVCIIYIYICVCVCIMVWWLI